MGFFDTVESVDPSGASPRFPPNGDFIFRVNECRVHQGQWGTRFILEADVISSSLPDVGSGTRRSWTCQIDGAYGKIGIGEVKAFAAAAYGIDPTNTVEANAKITKAVMDAVIGPGQPLAGRVIRTTTVEKTTKSVNDMTKHVWYVVDAATVASLGLSVPSGPPAAPPHVPPPPGALGALGAPPPPAAGPFPPIGWTAHPSAPGYFYKGADVKSEADLRAAALPPPPPALPPPPPPPPPAAGPFPPIGWTAHPSAPGYFYKGADVKSEADLRAAAARGIV